MLRFVFVLTFYFYISAYFIVKMKIYLRTKKDDFEFRYRYTRKSIRFVAARSRATVKCYGEENLPEENGYVMLANHQGKFDVLAVVSSHEKPLSVVAKKKKTRYPLVRQVMEMLDSTRIDTEDLRSVATAFRDVERNIENGRNYLIFPEGKFGKNHNHLIEFHTGCIGIVKKTKCPIVPVALYDTYKVYNENSLKKTECSVTYLSPIYYEEYKDLSKREIADLVKQRIEDVIDQIENDGCCAGGSSAGGEDREVAAC